MIMAVILFAIDKIPFLTSTAVKDISCNDVVASMNMRSNFEVQSTTSVGICPLSQMGVPLKSLIIISVVLVDHDVLIETLEDCSIGVKHGTDCLVLAMVNPLLSLIWISSTFEWIQSNIVKTCISWIVSIFVRYLNGKLLALISSLMDDIEALAINHFLKLETWLKSNWLL